ncbi:MAG: ATP-binding protein [Gemmataceae bacterium]
MSTPDKTPLPRGLEYDHARHDMTRVVNLSEPRNLRETFHQLCRIAAEALAIERVGIWLFTPHRKAIRCACLYERTRQVFSEGVTLNISDFPEHFTELTDRFESMPGGTYQGPCSLRMKSAYHDPLGITAILDAPIVIEGALVGCACHEQTGEAKPWTTADRAFSQDLAAAIAVTLSGLSLHDAWQRLRSDSSAATDERIREATAQISAGVAHDFRNLLQIVIGNAQLIGSDPDATPNMIERIKHILDAADRGAMLATELTAIGKNQAGQPRIVSASDAVSNFLPLLRDSVGPDHRVEFQNIGGDAKVFIDPMQLERIVLNLVLNAREASTRGGAIDIAVEGRSREHPESVQLSVSDHGAGIDRQHLNRVFDPFFTTKPKGKGSGFGLSIVKRFVELAGGSIAVRSTVGTGTTVCCTLPRASFVG